MRFFASRDQNGQFEQVFAVSHDDRAVEWRYDQPGWRPHTPSFELARQVADDATLELLDQLGQERLWTLSDPPRNFSLEWRTEESWSGPVSVGLLLFPGIPLWFVWEQMFRSGLEEVAIFITILAQGASLMLLRDPLVRGIVRLQQRLDARRPKQKNHIGQDHNPARAALLHSLNDLPEERLHELAAIGAKLTRGDAERNLQVRTRKYQTMQTGRQPRQSSSNFETAISEETPNWTVYVDDNFHYMDEDEQYVLGSFGSYEEALAACRQVVDEYLARISANTADELFDSYVAFGEDPWIDGPAPSLEQSRFSAWDYAKARSSALYPKA